MNSDFFSKIDEIVLFCLFQNIVKIDEIVLCEIVLFDCNWIGEISDFQSLFVFVFIEVHDHSVSVAEGEVAGGWVVDGAEVFAELSDSVEPDCPCTKNV